MRNFDRCLKRWTINRWLEGWIFWIQKKCVVLVLSSDCDSDDRWFRFQPVSQVTWHGKGDYFSTITPDAVTMSVIIHQLTKQRSQVTNVLWEVAGLALRCFVRSRIVRVMTSDSPKKSKMYLNHSGNEYSILKYAFGSLPLPNICWLFSESVQETERSGSEHPLPPNTTFLLRGREFSDNRHYLSELFCE